VNKTDSAVRITHLPTGIVVQCQNERSQHKNKATALKILRARLYEKEWRRNQKDLKNFIIRRKRLHGGVRFGLMSCTPYRMVKDHRTNQVIHDVDRVMDGDIDEFMKTYLLSASSMK